MLEPIVAKRLRVIGFDVDGVLTDNGVYIGTVGGESVELKRFHVQDGLGIKLLQLAGLKVVLVSGRVSKATEMRATELAVDGLAQEATAQKLPAFLQFLEESNAGWEEAAFVGDDLADVPLLKRVAVPIAVRNAVPEVKDLAQVTTDASGGMGAAREVAELILRARGAWNDTLAKYFEARGEIMGRPSGKF